MTPAYTNCALDNAWPFWVLELPLSASTADIEKASRNISAKLTLKAPGAETFTTPAGQQQRDEFLVREAKAALQNPATRLLAEFWYLSPNESENQTSLTKNSKEELEYWLKTLGVAL